MYDNRPFGGNTTLSVFLYHLSIKPVVSLSCLCCLCLPYLMKTWYVPNLSRPDFQLIFNQLIIPPILSDLISPCPTNILIVSIIMRFALREPMSLWRSFLFTCKGKCNTVDRHGKMPNNVGVRRHRSYGLRMETQVDYDEQTHGRRGVAHVEIGGLGQLLTCAKAEAE